ncbi:diaminopimelate decarboxylase [Proteiniclasticum sp. BAD-10]|uniref:Diaminopimelate decarboxylase n=1 Tax=Proteiniclasticum sediminis TaxID=2804028 RepID=A0A941HR25_9CLOT|nr:diaminopimelate decarboxylase [Proteiniclasticum sediminis]MBR0577124.1 diaminopimelate decarboxylase [Proteiniclasticum sediminis]
MISETQKVHPEELHIGGVSARALAEKYGTPLYVMDEEAIRQRMREFKYAMGKSSLATDVLYASKAFLTLAMVKIIQEEDLSLDVVSGGELYTALAAGFDPSRIYFHGNNKSPEELEYALASGVGTIIVDNEDEVERMESLWTPSNGPQSIILRVNPGIEAHTHEYISTTKNDSKFGLSIFQEETLLLLQRLQEDPRFSLQGIHCHIGSQIFEKSSFFAAAEEMLQYVAKLYSQGVVIRTLNLGGGFGVRYVEGDEPVSPEDFLPELLKIVENRCQELGIPPLKILIEPGRAIVANAGTTLYRVGGTKTTFGGKNYVFVDGSMADHIRTVLYGAEYEAVLAERMTELPEETYTITGKACESGDILVREARLPKPRKGEILAILSTGAYHYSMASNYNRLPKPAVVMVREGKSRLVVKRETYEDLIRQDVEEEYEA